MLVVSRRVGESIRLGDDIEVMVVEIRDGKVRLGISAPADVRVLRQELFDRIQAGEADIADLGRRTHK